MKENFAVCEKKHKKLKIKYEQRDLPWKNCIKEIAAFCMMNLSCVNKHTKIGKSTMNKKLAMAYSYQNMPQNSRKLNLS